MNRWERRERKLLSKKQRMKITGRGLLTIPVKPAKPKKRKR